MLLISVITAVALIMVFEILAKKSMRAVDKIQIGMIDYDQSSLSKDLNDYIESSLGMNIIANHDYDFQSKKLIDRNISAIIEIPEGFYNSALKQDIKQLEITTLDDYENAAFIEVYLNSYMQGIQILSNAAKGNEDVFLNMLLSGEDIYTVKENERNGNDSAYIHSAFIFAQGFMLMMIAGIMLFVSKSILDDRQQGTYERLLCSSMKPVQYIVGMALFGIICGTASNLIFNIYIYLQHTKLIVPFGVSVLAGELYVLFSVGFSIMVALLIQSTQTLFPLGIGYTTFGCMLGGAWFPIADNLGILGNIAKIFPQYWFMHMLRDSTENPDYQYVYPLCILALFALLVYLISAVIYRPGDRIHL